MSSRTKSIVCVFVWHLSSIRQCKMESHHIYKLKQGKTIKNNYSIRLLSVMNYIITTTCFIKTSVLSMFTCNYRINHLNKYVFCKVYYMFHFTLSIPSISFIKKLKHESRFFNHQLVQTKKSYQFTEPFIVH